MSTLAQLIEEALEEGSKFWGEGTFDEKEWISKWLHRAAQAAIGAVRPEHCHCGQSDCPMVEANWNAFDACAKAFMGEAGEAES